MRVLASSGPAGIEARGSGAVKDWSNDDTEPGDDEVFDSAAHRIIDPDEEGESGL